jgi:hypothetical protein
MSDPYVVITAVENGFTIVVCGVPYPKSFIALTPKMVGERLTTILEDLQQ